MEPRGGDFGDGALRAYINGRLAAEATKLRGKITRTELPLRFGADSGQGSRFSGLMDDVRIYRKALTAEGSPGAGQRGNSLIRAGPLDRIVHGSIVTRSVSEVRSMTNPRLRFGLRFRTLRSYAR